MPGTIHKSQAAVAGSPPQARVELPDPLRWIWLALVSGLFFSRWWQAAEGTVLGDTLGIAEGWFLALALAGWIGLRGTSWTWRLDGCQWAVGLLVLGHVISGLWVVATTGDKRAALNLVWEWAAVGVSFPLLRCALARPETRREWLVISLAAVLTLGGYGLTQRYIFYPRMAAEYDRIRNELDQLEEAAASGAPINVQRMQKLRGDLLGSGLSTNMLGGSGRLLFEDRLKHSTEALGRFALANTFAGLLLVWWGILMVLTLRQWMAPRATAGPAAIATRPRQQLRNVLLLICSLIVGYCLLLTKSRTGYVGAAVSLTVWSVSMQSSWFRSVRQVLIWALLGVLAAGGLTLLAGLTGGLDRLVLAEAPKSLQYRLEYWWGSLQVIRESPLLGTGPGQFRQHYLRHKLPRSSEEIADPHNLFLDAWANSGLLGLVGLTWLACLVIRRALGKSSGPSTASPPPPISGTAPIALPRTVRESGVPPAAAEKIPQPKTALRASPSVPDVATGCVSGWKNPLRCGALASIVALWVMGGALETLLLILLVAWIAAIEIVNFCLPEQSDWGPAWGAVGLGLMVHLCGAGGIGMPAINQLLIVILILGDDEKSGRHLVLKSWQMTCMLLGGIGLFVGGYVTAARPAGTCRWLCDQGDYSTAPERSYRAAIEADSLSPEPWEKLAEVYFHKWRVGRDPDERDFQQAVAAERKAKELNPQSYHTYQSLGVFYGERIKRFDAAEDKVNAVKELQAAIDRYPHNASLLADATVVFNQAGQVELAKQTALRTLEQDDINHAAGHSDKWLSVKTRSEMERLARGD